MHIPVGEDDPFVAGILGVTLEEAGYFTITAYIIEKALFELKHTEIMLFYWILIYPMEMAREWRA